MRRLVTNSVLTLSLLGITASSVLAQGIPTTQPKFLHIFMEKIKPGRAAEHSKFEAGWPAAFEKANNPYHYIALQSVTGTPEVWYVSTLASQAAYGEMLAAESGNPALEAELDRLAQGDSEFLTEQSAMQAVAMPELSHGEFPDIAKMRFWEISTFRVKPGQREEFIAACKAYVSAAARIAPTARWRMYEVVAGAPGGTYLVFSSVKSFGEFDKDFADGEAIWKGLSTDERAALQKGMSDAILSTMSNRYRLDPRQSYVSKEVRQQDAAFWMPKAGTATATSTPVAATTATSVSEAPGARKVSEPVQP